MMFDQKLKRSKRGHIPIGQDRTRECYEDEDDAVQQCSNDTQISCTIGSLVNLPAPNERDGGAEQDSQDGGH